MMIKLFSWNTHVKMNRLKRTLKIQIFSSQLNPSSYYFAGDYIMLLHKEDLKLSTL